MESIIDQFLFQMWQKTRYELWTGLRHFLRLAINEERWNIKNLIMSLLWSTLLPRLVRMRTCTIKLMSFSGLVLTERAYYPRGFTIQLLNSWPISQIYFSTFFIEKALIWSHFLNFLTFLDIFEQGTLIWNSCNTDRFSLLTQKHSKS